jgi:hypothetical protein
MLLDVLKIPPKAFFCVKVMLQSKLHLSIKFNKINKIARLQFSKWNIGYLSENTKKSHFWGICPKILKKNPIFGVAGKAGKEFVRHESRNLFLSELLYRLQKDVGQLSDNPKIP